MIETHAFRPRARLLLLEFLRIAEDVQNSRDGRPSTAGVVGA